MPRAPVSAAPAEGDFLYLSSLLRRPVEADSGQRLGRVADVLVEAEGGVYPRVCALWVRRDRRLTSVAWEDVAHVGPWGVRLRPGAPLLAAAVEQQRAVPLARELLDTQVVDTHGAKARRVNDLVLVRAGRALHLSHADVGRRGLVRRLGWERAVDGLVRALRPRARYLTRSELIPWRYIQPLAPGSGRLQLAVAREALAAVHPADLVEVLEDLSPRARAILFRQLPLEAAADALEAAGPALQRELLGSVPPARAADVLEEMEPDERADLLGGLAPAQARRLLEEMTPADASEVRALLPFAPDTAGGMMTPDFLRLSPTQAAGEALAAVRSQAREVKLVQEAFALDAQGGLVGVVPLAELLLADPGAPLDGLLQEAPVTVAPDVPADRVAELAAKYHLLALPVQAEGRMLGVVTVDDVLERVVRG